MAKITLYRLGSKEPLAFAAEELRRCLALAAGTDVEVREGEPGGASGIRLGTFDHFPEVRPRSSGDPFDDEIFIDVRGGAGVIAGANPRSVLLAAYRYLTELGFRWVRPGADGELVPALSLPLPDVALQETPSYRHRGVCIEGAVSYEHVRDLVDWLPKVGMNAYFIQFREAYQFFVRWYHHEGNPTLPAEPFSIEDAREYTRRVRREVERRGLILNMVGHGWTCDPFGVPGLGWERWEQPLPEGYRGYLAEVGGKRDLWGGIPLNTNLCYGNAEARATVARAVADYAAENPDAQIVHLWLADGSNNNCECPLCRDHLPSDLYVKLCNEVDAELTRRGLPTRVVFLIYVDLLWPPEKERLANPDRFILMFAPITRTYTTSFTTGGTGEGAIPPFARNKLQFPRSTEGNLAFLRGWQHLFAGDSFDFDYHLMWDHHKDPGYHRAAEVLHEDIRGLADIGLNGLMSCQLQRSFFPTGLMMAVLGRTLWNREVAFDAVADDLYRASFGEGWQQVKEYTRQLSILFDPPLLRGERDEAGRAESARKLAGVPALIEEILPAIEARQADANPCRAASWRYLRLHADLCLALAPALEALARGDKEGARAAGERLIELARRQEPETHPVFDTCLFVKTIGRPLGVV